MPVGGDYTRYLQFGANIRLAATNGFTKGSGFGFVAVAGDGSGVTGKMISLGPPYSGSGVRIENTGNIRNVSEFDCQNGAFRVIAPTGSVNQIGDNAVVRLRGAMFFAYQGSRGTTASAESMSQIVLSSAGILNLNTAGSGSGSPLGRLYLTHPTAGIDRGPDGKGTLHFDATATDTFLTDVVVSNGTPAGVLLPWMTTLQCRPVQLNVATKVLEPLAVTTAPSDLSTWVPGSSYRIENNFVPVNVLPNISVNSLGIYNTNGTFAITVGSTATDTLTIASGLISFYPVGVNGAKYLGGGQLTSGTNELYILTGNSSAAQSLNISNVVAGSLSFIKAGSSTVIFRGTATNTYTGTTYINSGTLQMDRTSDQSCIPGDAVVGWGGTLYQDVANNTISTNANITVREGGTFTINNSCAQTISGVLTMNGGVLNQGGYGNGITLNRPGTGLVFSNGGTFRQNYVGQGQPLKILTDVRYDAASSNQALFTTTNLDTRFQYIDLTSSTNATRTFNIADSVSLPATTPEMVFDEPLDEADGQPATLNKTGTGALQLQRLTGRFSGGITVSGGTLVVTGPFATQSVHTLSWSVAYPATVNIDSTNGLFIGQPLRGLGVQTATVIQSIGPGNQITLTKGILIGSPGTNTFTNLACSAAGICNITVGPGGTLAGDSEAAGNVTVSSGGVVAPGTPANSFGVFTITGNLDLSSGGTLAVDVSSATNDVVSVGGNVTLGGPVTVAAATGYRIPDNQYLPILTAGGTISGQVLSATGGYVAKPSADHKQLLLYRRLPGLIFSAY